MAGQATQGPNNGELPTFDGWRGVAILAVLLHHFSIASTRHPTFFTESVLGYGSRGVDVFFAISGFLICNRLLVEEKRYGNASIPDFYIRRIFRILPLVLMYLLALAFISSTDWQGWRASLFFYRNYSPDLGWTTRHLWSLSVEEHFYVLMPVLFVLASQTRMRAFVTFAALLAVWAEVDSRLHLIAAPEIRYRTDYRMTALLCGCIAAVALWEGRRFIKRIPKPEITLPLLGLLFVALEILPKPARFTFQAPLVPIMLLSTTLHPASLVSRFLQLRPLAWIGKVSYGLYVWQQFFITPEPNVLMIQRLPWNLAALAAVVTVSFFCIERPLINLGRRLCSRPAGLSGLSRAADSNTASDRGAVIPVQESRSSAHSTS